MDPPTNQPAGASSSFKTPQMDQSEWSAATPTTTTTPSRHTFPRRLSLLQNDAASPARSETPQEASRRTSFTGPKPLNLVSQPLSSAAVPSSASSSGPDTPRKGKRTSLSYIPSPSTSKIDDGQLSRAQSTSSAAGRTRTGSISRATTSSRRRPSQASQASAGANSDADDWLMSEEDASFSLPSAARAMAGRDSAKVEAQFQDTGYREGITAGKLSTLQNGFDQGFNEVGAPLGREVGMLRGQLAALLLLTSPSPSADAAGPRKGVGRATGRMRPANSAATPSLPLLGHPRLAEAQREMRALAAELDSVSLGQLAEPDYDALVHDHEHAVEAGDAAAQPSRETEEQRQARTAVLVRLHKRHERNGALTGPTRDLLRLIAEKERRCFELRDELAAEEAELKQLRAAWQRTATRELAYGTSPTHRRNGSASSSTTRPSLARTDSTDSLAGLPVGVPQAAAEAWNSLSAKLPGGLKSQLNSLLESIAMDQPPEVPEKRAEDAGMLRPAPLGTLGVLEEEGSDVGSAAVSPRSPRSPAGPMAGVRGAAQEQDDSSVLGFKVDANGIATPSVRLSEQPPPTPPKEGAREGNTWQSRRTSVLGSWSQLQSKLTGEADSGGGGLAGMFTRRLKEARHNASDLLREAERKLGNAMTIDELLGISNDEPPSPQPPMARSRSPQIRLEGVATETSWAEAAVGVRSPNLAPADAVGRTSASSSRSSLSLQLPVRSASPHSPPIGGAPGAAAFGVLHNGSSSSINRVSTNSVDGWNWTKHEHEWDE